MTPKNFIQVYAISIISLRGVDNVGLFYEIFGVGKKKHCTICGCIMYPDSESDICEICLDELYDSIPIEEEL